MKNLVEKIKTCTNNASDIVYKMMIIDKKEIYFIYSDVLTDSTSINDFLLKNMAFLIDENRQIKDLYDFLFNSIPAHDVKEVFDYKEVLNMIWNGFACFYDGERCFVMEYRAGLDRGVQACENEIAIRGPKDSFTENFNKNLGLIRRRIKSEHLWIDKLDVGKSTKTKVGLLYMENICDKRLVDQVQDKLNKIDIDGILDVGYIKNMILDEDKVFPTVITTERPDLASMALLEGKIVLISDTSPYALILPAFFLDFFHTPDDYYQKKSNISFIRIVRLIAFLVSIFLPAYYIAITTYNHDSISIDLLLNFISQRRSVAFPALVEALLMMVSFEILRESDTRMASTVGSAVSILGGIILGDALVSAGIISPIMIIVVAVSAISGLVFTSVELSNAIRLYRFLGCILASFLGIYGIYILFILLTSHLASITSLNFPYLFPISPFNMTEHKDGFVRYEDSKVKLRNPLLAKKNIVRGRKQ